MQDYLKKVNYVISILMFVPILLVYISMVFGFAILPIGFRLITIILLYAFVATLLWWNSDEIESLHLDRATLILIVVNGVVRSKLGIQNEIFVKWALVIICGAILVAIWKRRDCIPKPKWSWTLIGLILSLVVIPLSFIESLQPERYSDVNIQQINVGLLLIRRFLTNLSFVAISEEVLFRGILWRYLQRLGWNDSRVFWCQAMLFWLTHIWEIGSPITFFITIPIGTLLFSLLTRFSKQLFPSILLHLLLDTIAPFIVYYILQ